MSDPEIVKVQRPLVSNEDGEPCLIYDSRRNRQVMVPFDNLPAIIQRGLDRAPKVYCEAKWRGRKGWDLVRLVKDQPW